jgi:DNA-directed RNA polymerase alpha subunit
MSKIPKIAEKALRHAAAGRHPVSNLEQLGINQRLINLLETNGMEDMFQLLSKNKDELLAIPNFGQKQLDILLESFSRYHLVENS